MKIASTNHQPQCHAVYTRMHHERKVADRLAAHGIKTFVPYRTEVRQWSDREKKIDRLLIPMMIFVYVTPRQQLQVLQTPSVTCFMKLRGHRHPTPIPNAQMEGFQLMVEKSNTAVNFQSCHLAVGNCVRVVQGPLSGLVGQLVTIKGKTNIAIRIDSIGCATVEMATHMVEKLAE